MRSLVPLVFFVLAALLAFDSRREHLLPIPPVRGVTEAELHLGPPRAALGDPPTIQNGPFRQACSECHDLFPSPDVPRSPLLQHTHVVLDHGRNDRCYNCHAREQRDLLVLHDGSTLGYGAVENLCAQCHGTVFRDWQGGTHGRTSGHWDRAAGESVRLSCTQCHDPHAPAYPRFVPLPGPNTLRMGRRVSGETGHQAAANPLEKWKAHLAVEEPPRPGLSEEIDR